MQLLLWSHIIVVLRRKDDDVAWQEKKRDHALLEMAYTLENQKRVNTNKRCIIFYKRTQLRTLFRAQLQSVLPHGSF